MTKIRAWVATATGLHALKKGLCLHHIMRRRIESQQASLLDSFEHHDQSDSGEDEWDYLQGRAEWEQEQVNTAILELTDTFPARYPKDEWYAADRDWRNVREKRKRAHDRRKRWGCPRGPGAVSKIEAAFTLMSS